MGGGGTVGRETGGDMEGCSGSVLASWAGQTEAAELPNVAREAGQAAWHTVIVIKHLSPGTAPASSARISPS